MHNHTRMSGDIKDTKDGENGTWKDIGSEKQSLTRMPHDEKNKKDGESITWEDVGWFTLKTTAISAVVLGGTALALPAIGFTAGGVAAGSWAASFQSAYLGGTIASGSGFALFQSAGAVGLAATTKAAAIAGSAGVVGTHSAVKKFMTNDETDSQHTSEESRVSKSTFGLLQSAGATGLAASSQAAGIATNAVVAGANSIVKKFMTNDETDRQHTSEELNASKSTFALLRNAGAAGLTASSHAAGKAASAVVAGAHSVVKKLKKNDEIDSGHTSEESSASGNALTLLKSAGTAGLAASSQAAIAAGSAVVAGAHSAVKILRKNNESDSGHTPEESSVSWSALTLLKSAGTAGLAASSQAAITAGSTVVAGAHSVVKKFKKNNETDSEK